MAQKTQFIQSKAIQRNRRLSRNCILAILTSISLILAQAGPTLAGIEDTAAELGKDKPEAPPAAPPPTADPPAPLLPPTTDSSAPAAEGSSPTPAPTTDSSAPTTPPGEAPSPATGTASPAQTPSQPAANPSTSQPATNQSPAAPSPKLSTVRRLNFVDVQAGVLGPGDPVSDHRYYHVYYFEGKANQPIELRLVGSRDPRLGLDPVMFVYGPNGGDPIARRYGGSDSDRSSFLLLRLPTTGTYSVVVTSKEPRAKGRYSLAMREDRSSYLLDTSGSLTDQSRTLTKDKSPFEVIEFRGRRDQFVNIRVDSVRSEFAPSVYLLDSKNHVISTSGEVNSLYTAQIERARLPEEGTYYIVVNSARPSERGQFRVSVY